jgi:hypothetical protein
MNCTHFVKQPNLKLKTWPKQLLGFLPLAFELPGLAYKEDGVNIYTLKFLMGFRSWLRFYFFMEIKGSILVSFIQFACFMSCFLFV